MVALQVLERGEPYPQVILPEFGGYWIEDPEAPPPPPAALEAKGEEGEEGEEGEGDGALGRREEEDIPPGDYGYRLEEISEAARAYRKFFLGRVRIKVKIIPELLELIKELLIIVIMD